VSTSREQPSTVVVGRIGRPHGVRGVVTVESLSDVEERFAPGQSFLVLASEQGPATGRLTIDKVADYKGGLLVTFLELEDRDQALEQRGRWLAVSREDVPEAEEGSYYYFELLGCAVADAELGELGVVVDLVEDGGGLLLEIEAKDENGKVSRYLVPFVAAFVSEVDVEGARITTLLPPGLLETCVSTS
jgi:16S rRNA processing protein RimM